jgi:hypothetical protein
MKLRTIERAKRQIDRRPPPRYVGEEIRYFCGHWVALPIYLAGLKEKVLTCPKCGMSWRGYQVINRNKSLPKKELREAALSRNQGTREFFKK